MNNNVSCLICKNSNKTKFVDNYKFNVESDVKYFGDLKIFGCEDCDFYFVNPVPDLNKLNYYYSNIYRARGRPHYLGEGEQVEKNYIDDKNLNYLSYLSTFIDFKKIKNIFDFGAGIGDLGYLIKKRFNHINLYCCENDKYSISILKKRGYQNYKNLQEIDKKFDLIITLHTIHQLTNLNYFFHLMKLLAEKGHLFFEEPNCPFNKNYIKRPYDSPQLLFFTEKSWEKISRLSQLNLIDLSYGSFSLKERFFYMAESKKRFGKWNINKIDYKNLIKKFIPYFILNLRKKIIQTTEYNNQYKSDLKINNIKDSWCLRGIFKAANNRK